MTRNRPRHDFVVSIIYSVEQSLTITCTNYEVTDVHEVVLMSKFIYKCSTLIKLRADFVCLSVVPEILISLVVH